MTTPRKWAFAEIEKLKADFHAGRDLSDIARELGRSRDAVYQKAVTTGLLSKNARLPRPKVSRYSRLFGD